MKIRTTLYAVLSFLGLYIGAGSYVVAGSTLELTQKPQEISGIDRESGVAFGALLTSSDHVVIDASVGGKQIHGDIDYKLKTLSIRSFSKSNGASISLSAQDIGAFQKLLVSLPPAVNTGSRHGDALTSFVNLIASAPPAPVDINDIRCVGVTPSPSYTPICDKIGGAGVAIYRTGIFRQVPHSDPVTVGPFCYIGDALGRCGAGAGPDPTIGLVQRFTQECLNHDECCVATGPRENCLPILGCANVCGKAGTNECVPEFKAAACGFLFAPDCGTTAGNWTMDGVHTWVLTGGDSSGQATAFSGTVNTEVCGIWNVAGTRTGKNIGFAKTNPSFGLNRCAASVTFTGAYTDCNVASGSWTNSRGFNGLWSWHRTNTVGAQAVSVPANTTAPAWSRGPARQR